MSYVLHFKTFEFWLLDDDNYTYALFWCLIPEYFEKTEFIIVLSHVNYYDKSFHAMHCIYHARQCFLFHALSYTWS